MSGISEEQAVSHYLRCLPHFVSQFDVFRFLLHSFSIALSCSYAYNLKYKSSCQSDLKAGSIEFKVKS